MPVLPVIAYHSAEFSSQSFEALKSYGAFILKDVSEFSSAGHLLLQEFDDFLYQPDKIIEQFRGGSGIHTDELPGVHLREDHWAGRRFSACYGLIYDEKGKVTQPLPSEHFRQVSLDFFDAAHAISDKTLNAIKTGFNFDSRWTHFFEGYTILGVADMYTVPTQEKIIELASKEKLTTTNEGRLEAFNPHKDFGPLTVIHYGNNDSSGLEMQIPDETGKLTYKPVHLPEIAQNESCAVVLLGKAMEILTGGQLKAPEHRVVLDSLQPGQKFNRKLASAFTLFGSNRKLEPLTVTTPSIPGSSQSTDGYWDAEFVSAENKQAVRSHQSLPEEVLACFPKESEIVKEKSTGGTVYARRA